MNEVLEEWDEEKRGFRRPKVLYTVPTGQNPTGKYAIHDFLASDQ
jgi:aromatic amino acid aminotransferase I